MPEEVTDEICPYGGKNLVVKNRTVRQVPGLPGFPDCKFTKRIVQDTGGVCPCAAAGFWPKRSKSGKNYYGCEHNPTCSFMSWDQPLTDRCPSVATPSSKSGGKQGKVYCAKGGCYERSLKEQ